MSNSGLWEGALWASSLGLSYFSVTDPSINEAVSTSVVDKYNGVIILTTGTSNAQTIQDPTNVNGLKEFIVINDDTSSHSVTVNSIIIEAGKGQKFFWDETAWIVVGANGIQISDLETTVGDPGSDEKAVSEQGIREALNVVNTKTVKATYFAEIGSGTTAGQVTKPAGAGADVNFIMDEWGTGTDALLSTIENGKPTFKSPVDAGGNTITTTFDTAGDYSFSATPDPAAVHALIYVYTCYIQNLLVAETLFETELVDYIPDEIDIIKASHLDFGHGADQINSDVIPDHNGHTIKDTFGYVLNRGKTSLSTITLTGGLGISWIEHEIFDPVSGTFITISAGSGNLTDNSPNFLLWVSGTTATIATSCCSGDDITLVQFDVYDGVIADYREASLSKETIANTRRGLRVIIPTFVVSGLGVTEDTDVTNALDVTMDSAEYWKDGIEHQTPVEIKSRNTAMVRHFHTAGVWGSDTNAEIDTANYNNPAKIGGQGLEAIPAQKWVKSYFIHHGGKIGWVYPVAYFTVEADAIAAALPPMPPGLVHVPKSTALVYQQGAAALPAAGTDYWQDIRPGKSQESFNIVTVHNLLGGLNAGDYQHLTAAQKTIVTRAATNALSGYATAAQITMLEAAMPRAGLQPPAPVAFAGSAGYTITHNYGHTDYQVIINPVADPGGFLGEIWYNKSANTVVVYNTGSATGNFDYVITPDE